MTAMNNQPLNSETENSLRQPASEDAPKIFRYEAIAELLNEVRSSCELSGNESLLCMVDAAYRICRACRCAWDEVEWHKQAYSQAHQRQFQLLQELTALIEMISPTADLTPNRQLSLLNFTNSDSVQSLNAASAKYERLVQCIKDLLEPVPFKKPLPPTADSQSKNDAEKKVPPKSVEYIQTPETVMGQPNNNPQAIHPALAIYFLSPFRVLLDEQPVVGWPNCKGKSIFKYLITHRQHPIPKEVLMEIFWPEGDPDAARNNLNVAIYGLRKALSKANTSFSYVQFQDDCYLLNPELNIWVDSEAFMDHVRKAKAYELRGDQTSAIHEYRAAEAIYQSEFLIEDRYEDWLTTIRQNYQDTYLAVMNRLSCHYFDQKDYETCVTMCSKALSGDACNEELHRRLMQCYNLMGYTHLALRQYHICRETLTRELSLMPSQETLQLFEGIRRR